MFCKILTVKSHSRAQLLVERFSQRMDITPYECILFDGLSLVTFTLMMFNDKDAVVVLSKEVSLEKPVTLINCRARLLESSYYLLQIAILKLTLN